MLDNNIINIGRMFDSINFQKYIVHSKLDFCREHIKLMLENNLFYFRYLSSIEKLSEKKKQQQQNHIKIYFSFMIL